MIDWQLRIYVDRTGLKVLHFIVTPAVHAGYLRISLMYPTRLLRSNRLKKDILTVMAKQGCSVLSI